MDDKTKTGSPDSKLINVHDRQADQLAYVFAGVKAVQETPFAADDLADIENKVADKV